MRISWSKKRVFEKSLVFPRDSVHSFTAQSISHSLPNQRNVDCGNRVGSGRLIAPRLPHRYFRTGIISTRTALILAELIRFSIIVD